MDREGEGDMDNKITYEEMEAMYRKVSEGSIKPDLVYSNLKNLQNLYGHEQVEEWLNDGTIVFLTKEDLDVTP